jgi:hypothetical protein
VQWWLFSALVILIITLTSLQSPNRQADLLPEPKGIYGVGVVNIELCDPERTSYFLFPRPSLLIPA